MTHRRANFGESLKSTDPSRRFVLMSFYMTSTVFFSFVIVEV